MKVCKTIYSWQPPEVKTLVSELWQSNLQELYEKNFLGQQEGKEIIFKETWLNWTSPVLNLTSEDYKFFYPTNGSSEAIREVIYQLKLQGRTLHVFENEYEGYKAFASACNLKVIEHPRNQWQEIKLTSQDTFILSQPSSLDGNLWADYEKFLNQLQKESPGCEVYVDLCYVGCVAKNYQIKLDYSIINGLFISLSKAFGVYFHRIGGLLTKEDMPGLYGNRWFKNMFSLHLGIELMKKFKVKELPQKYKEIQLKTINEINQESLVTFCPSDVLILAHSCQVVPEYARGNLSRVCLTPSFTREASL